MLVATGYFDNTGSPCLKFHIQGVHDTKVELDGIVDTGFTGFISMPLVRALPLGLPLYGTSTSTLADGSSCAAITAQARVTVGERGVQIGIVTLHGSSSDVLIGMDFLRKFNIALMVTKDHVMLFDESALLNTTQSEAKSAPAPVTSPPTDPHKHHDP
ncbi:hypothetical protein [Dokdonella sp.]|uniref:hypothetical protein n=1 Tax=Dokdonella sp. TaxID=2291710 RepID=UPI00326400CA